MPQYILDSSGTVETVEFRQLDEFTQGYIEALFFTSECIGVDRLEFESAIELDGTIPGDAGFNDLSPDALASIRKDCAEFQRIADDLLALAFAGDYDAAQAGRDFWYTRNGHGCGFWDRGLGQVGDDLSNLCGWRTSFGEVDAYWRDGKVYLA